MRSGFCFLISACLCGQSCRYNGTSALDTRLRRLAEQGTALVVCPEMLGELGVPREPCEIASGRVTTVSGRDVTRAFYRGAQKTLALARLYGIRTAILHERSPSCGLREIYDGSFSGRLQPGQGITTALLRAAGIRCLSPKAFFALFPGRSPAEPER